MKLFIAFVLAISVLSALADLLVFGTLISRHEKPVRVWGRLAALVYHVAVSAWASLVLGGV